MSTQADVEAGCGCLMLIAFVAMTATLVGLATLVWEAILR